MKIVILLFLLAYSQAVPAEVKKKEQGKTEKRALVEGNAGIEKRAPAIDTASPSPIPGIVYAESTQAPSDKSPTHSLATPQPQVAKISDVLSGQGHSFPTAIENHLYSPVQVYQPRLGSPTTYEVSAPIPAQLAYTETKTYQQPQQNSIFFDPRKEQKQFARVTVNFGPQPYQQHFLEQQHQFLQQPPQQFLQQQPQQFLQQSPQQFIHQQSQQPIQQQPQQIIPQQPIQQNFNRQQVHYHQQPQSFPAPQFLHFHQFPQHLGSFNQAPTPYNQFPITFNHQPIAFNQQVPFNQHQQVPFIQPVQHGITYTNQLQRVAVQQPSQRDVKTSQPALIANEKPTFSQTQPSDKSQGAVSYASFSQSQPSSNYIQTPPTYSSPPTNNLLPTSPPASNYISPKLEAVSPVQNNIQPPKPVSNPAIPNRSNLITYYNRPQYVQAVPQFYAPQPQVYPQSQEVVVQNAGFAHAPVAAAPTFPPVQYFGKFAPQIFGGYHQ